MTNDPNEVRRAPAHRRPLASGAGLLVAVLANALTGCGLLLDAWPPDPVVEDRDAAVNGCVGGDCPDVGGGELDAGREGDADVIAGDADSSERDAGRETTDAGVGLDATALVDASIEAGLSSDAGSAPDARPIDGGSAPDARPIDGGPIDAGDFICVGVHPIVGPIRTCEAGSCLCTRIDTCFTADEVRACCADDFACAAPLPECMGTHPIVGPGTRTCERGSCYCGNPDACFPADRAARCCGVDVVCVL